MYWPDDDERRVKTLTIRKSKDSRHGKINCTMSNTESTNINSFLSLKYLRAPTNISVVEEKNTSSGNGSRSGCLQVTNLKDQSHGG